MIINSSHIRVAPNIFLSLHSLHLDDDSLLHLEGGGGLLLVLGEGPGLVGHGGEGDALAGRRPDEAGVGGDGDHPQGVPGGENSQGSALNLSCNRENVSLKSFMMQGIIF